MATAKKPTAESTEPTCMRQRRTRNVRIVQNFLLIWLDGTIDEINNEDCRNSITKLKQVVNSINLFTDAKECTNFIRGIREEKAFIISSGAFGQTTVPLIHNLPQVNSIYIFCGNKARHEQWAREWPKIKGVFTDIKPICTALKHAAKDCDENSVSISFVKTTNNNSNHNLNELNQSFMYTQIIKEILLTIDFEKKHFDEFLTYCDEQFVENTKELETVKKIKEEYNQHSPIWWYTYQCFLFSMLNRALRTMEVDLIINMGFFIRDLHQQIATLHSIQFAGQNRSKSFIVFRGQGLSSADFDQLTKTTGGLLAFNNFLSTSKDRNVSLEFVRRTMESSELVGVLFILKIDPSIPSIPFANIREVSYYQEEEEILFSMHSIFRIGQIKQVNGNNRLWQVDLTSTSDNDPQLHALTDHIRNETFPHETGWFRLGEVLITVGQLDKAQQVYDALLNLTSDDHRKSHIYNQLGRIHDNRGEYREALIFYENTLKIVQKTHPPNPRDLAVSYNNIGNVYDSIGEYSKALSFYEKALEIKQKTLPSNHSSLATSYNNIGLVYTKMGKYSAALMYYEKDLEICQKTLHKNHPDLAISYNNIGDVYDNMGDYAKALLYYEKSLEIRQKIFPPDDPSLAVTYNNIGLVYDKMNEYSKALSYLEKSLEIKTKVLLSQHPSLQTVRKNIELIKKKL